MISKRIAESAKFIKMPATSQNLYFHLVIHADDDGIVEALPVINLIHANEDDLRVLHSKGFIVILNEDLVSYICAWLEHNKIRLDRKVDSIYLDLLRSSLPDVEIRKRKEKGEVPAIEMTDTCQTADRQMSAEDSAGQNRSDKESTGNDSAGQDSIVAQLGKEFLTKAEYKDLSDKYSVRIVEKVIDKILNKPYPGCLNYATVDKWCDEQFKSSGVKKNFTENRKYDFEELERKLLGI